MAKNNLGKTTTSKWWATTIYKDCDIELIDKCLKGLHIPCALSPLHDKDIYEDTPNYFEDDVDKSNIFKEPHWHLMVCFPNSVGEKSFRYLLQHHFPSFVHYKGAELLRSEKGYGRYLIHLDNPEKAQYRREDILYYCGYNDSILESPRKNEREHNEDIRLFIQMINDFGIEDMMTLYKVVMMAMPTKIDLIIRYSSQLEKFTRAQYQCSMRKERINGTIHCDKNSAVTGNV